jgi:hypothetical protein
VPPFQGRRSYFLTPRFGSSPVLNNPSKTSVKRDAASAEPPSDIVWGAAAIGRAVNLSERQAFHLLEQKKLPAKKVGGKHCASVQRLKEACGA